MNEIMNKSLLAGDTFLPETHLRQPELKYSACVNHLLKTKKKRIQKFKETRDSIYIYLSKLDRACF